MRLRKSAAGKAGSRTDLAWRARRRELDPGQLIDMRPRRRVLKHLASARGRRMWYEFFL